MKKQKKQILWAGLGLLLSFVVWTVLVQTVDVREAGPAGTPVGFALLNGWFHRLTGVHMGIYTLTDWLGLVPAGICAGFGALGLMQAVRRKSLRKVDGDLLLLGVYYVLVIAGYLYFEMFPVNYRPIRIEGRLEASYPSSTTLLVLSVMPALIFQARRRLQNRNVSRMVCAAAVAFALFMVIGRLISGVHWVTDIVGGVLLSAGLFCIYCGAVV